MLTVYGTPLCKDCLAMKIVFAQKNVEYDYKNITETTTLLKEFLHLRDTLEMFTEIRANGGIGIPLFVCEQGKTFDINKALVWAGKAPIDAKELERITAECILLLE